MSDYRLSSEEDVYNHYVAATRAKTKLILVYVNGEWSAGQFAKNINNILGKSGLKMKDVATVPNASVIKKKGLSIPSTHGIERSFSYRCTRKALVDAILIMLLRKSVYFMEYRKPKYPVTAKM